MSVRQRNRSLHFRDMNPSDKRLDVSGAAEFLGVRPPTIRKWILKRQIPYVKVGRLVRIRQSDLEKLLERGTVPALGADVR